MTVTAPVLPNSLSFPGRQPSTSGRNTGIDSMRGIAILMVVAIHSLQQPISPSPDLLVDAALRPCVPIFLFASGYLTALSGRAPLAKRMKTALIPYAVAFVAAYIYMSLQNPAMDHRLSTAIVRFTLAYVFVYYYVFVYVGSTLCLWLVLRLSNMDEQASEQRLVVLLMLSITLGLIAGSYLDPLLMRLGLSGALVEEVRMRNIPFWFCFAALGALVALSPAPQSLRGMRLHITGIVLVTYIIYVAARLFEVGDAADYDLVAFFGYAATLCILLFALDVRLPFLATLGSGSYFIYLWHIFVVMALRDHVGLRQFGAAVSSSVIYAVTIIISIAALLAVRRFFSPRVVRWLGA